MYKIDCENGVYFYDERFNKLTSEDGFDVITYNERVSIEDNSLYVGKQERVYYNKDTIKYIRIVLGKKCNYKCKYCMESFNDQDIAPDYEKLFTRLQLSNLQWSSIKRIELWGGEPLLYFDELKKIVDFIRKTLKYAGQINISTNGSLLTHEIVDYLVFNRILTTISHDGPCFTSFRHTHNWLEDKDQRNVAKRLFDADLGKVFVVLGPHNYDVDSIAAYFESIFTDNLRLRFSRPVRVFTKNEPMALAYRDKKQVSQMVLQYEKMSNDLDNEYYHNHKEYFDVSVYNIVNGVGFYSAKGLHGSVCDPNLSITIDMQGNLLSCSNHDNDLKCVTGTLADITSAFMTIPQHTTARPPCVQCLYQAICRGGCSGVDAKTHAMICMSQKPYFKIFFKKIIEKIVNDVIIDIKRM